MSYTLPWKTSITLALRLKSLQTNGICQRFQKTMLNEFYRVAFRKRIYSTLDEVQADLDALAEALQRRANPSGTLVLR